MPSYEELVAAEQALRDVLAGGVEARLRAIPGVVHVSVGLKESGGRVTDQGSIRVYVREKLPADDVPPAWRIPREIDGIPTDVNVVAGVGFTADNTRYRPVIRGGIQITNRIVDEDPATGRTAIHRGTLGCIAVDQTDHSIVLLSNWHVLMANYARRGDRIYQPAPTTVPHLTPEQLADLPYYPPDDHDAIGRIVRYAITEQVDAAIARLDVSTWCRCCGLDYRAQVRGLSVDPQPPPPPPPPQQPRYDSIVGRRQAAMGMPVFKVGQQTGRTEGRVVETNYPRFCVANRSSAYFFQGQIQIASVDGTQPFSEPGDSGSAIIDA
ncbi:MAG TPA: hypothetical protein VF771_14740, partial [Longimicrobiaceae bacterium]